MILLLNMSLHLLYEILAFRQKVFLVLCELLNHLASQT
jgi:hypothetical protein